MENKGIEIVDLVNLSKIDRKQFTELFEEAHKIYCDSFPEYEQETKSQILDYIEKSADAIKDGNEIGTYNYLVPIVDGTPKGIHSLDFMVNDKGAFGTHTGTLAIGKESRGLGLSSILVNAIFDRTKAYAKQEGLKPLGLIGEVNIFERPEDVNKYAVRLKLHHNHLGFGAAVTIDENNYAKLIPYGSPGIIKKGQPADIMSFIMAITPFYDGLERKISTTPGKIISPSGKVLVNKNTLHNINSERIMEMQQMIFDSYASPKNTEIYSLDQISEMVGMSKKVLGGVNEVYLIPIMDTRYLK